MPKRKNKAISVPGKIIVLVSLVAVSILLFFLMLKNFFNRYAYFNINKVTIVGVNESAYRSFARRLFGKNIFSVDLGRLKNQVEQETGDSECVRLERRLPGELRFTLKRRIAIAQVKFLRYHCVDESGMLMAGASDIAYEGLPVIQGLEYKFQQANAKYYALEEAKKILVLIQEKNRMHSLKDYTIIRINLAKQKTSSFFIAENTLPDDLSKDNFSKAQIEVRFDPDKPVETIAVLGLLLEKRKASGNAKKEGKGSLAGIAYIDLTNTFSPVVLEKKDKGL